MDDDQRDASTKASPDRSSYAHDSPQRLLRHAAGNATVYSAGTFGIRGLEFLLLPLYWAFLPPREYGILAVAAVLTEFLKAVFGFGLPEAISRFYHQWPSTERPRRMGAIWTGAWTGSILFAGLLMAAGPWLFAPVIRAVPFDPYLRLAILVALTSALLHMPLMILRIMERPRLYIAMTAATTVLGAVLAITFIVGLDRGARGVLEAQALASGIVALAAGALMLRWVKPSLNLNLISEVLPFSLPLIPSKLIEAGATVADRFLLEKVVPLEALGIYQAARHVGRGVEMFGYSLLTAWIPFQMRVLAERVTDGRAVLARIATYFLFAVLLASVAVAVLVPDVMRLLGLVDYMPVIPLIPLVVLQAAILSMAHIVIQGYIIARKTQYAWIRSGSRLIVLVLAMWMLLPHFGLHGALAALAIAATVQGLVGYFLSQRFFPMPFRWTPVLLMAVVAIAVVWLSVLIPALSPLADLLVGFALVAAFGATMMTVVARLR